MARALLFEARERRTCLPQEDTTMTTRTWKRCISGLVLAGLAVAAVSPEAMADRGRARRYKESPGYFPAPVAQRLGYVPQRVYYGERHSSAAPLVAGLIGGFILGNAVAHAAPPVAVHASYEYYDPYCNEDFASLEIYRTHLYRHHHPRVVKVIEIHDGSCIDTYRWHEGGWRHFDDEDWDD
jgi:hypothetical protein